jgi:predicted nucleic acid-binding protein
MELYQGSRSALELRTTRNFVSKLEIRLLPITEPIGYRAVTLIEKHSAGDGLHLTDALIAATALEHDDTLLTGNVRHFRAIRGLKIKPFRHSGVH